MFIRRALIISLFLLLFIGTANSQVTVIKAGNLIDPETGTAAPNQIILIEEGRIKEIGKNVSIPADATVIDLTDLYVMPGLVDAHEHLTLTMKQVPEGNHYYLTTLMDSTPLRAVQGYSNAFQLLAYGFTVIRDVGNNGNYADSALRIAIDQGWLPGPTIINSGLIISGKGGQFWPNPEREGLVYPEYIEADTKDEIIKAVRKNALFGAKVIKIMVDSKPWGYTVDEIKLFIEEAAKCGLKVCGHVETPEGGKRAIEAGIWSIEHGSALNDELHKMMAEKGIWRVGTDFPYTSPFGGSKETWLRTTVAKIKNAYENNVPQAFGTDVCYYVPGKDRGELTLDFFISYEAAGIPAPYFLKMITTNAYKCCDIYDRRGPIKVGFPADIIAVQDNPLKDIDALCNVTFVMRDGKVFKKDGIVTPMEFFHGGPEYGWRRR